MSIQPTSSVLEKKSVHKEVNISLNQMNILPCLQYFPPANHDDPDQLLWDPETIKKQIDWIQNKTDALYREKMSDFIKKHLTPIPKGPLFCLRAFPLTYPYSTAEKKFAGVKYIGIYVEKQLVKMVDPLAHNGGETLVYLNVSDDDISKNPEAVVSKNIKRIRAVIIKKLRENNTD